MTKYPRLQFVLLRGVFTVFILLTAVYCVLTYIPFTYEQIHVAGLLPWLTTFVKIHNYLFWVSLGALVATLIPDLRRRETKILGYALLAVSVAVGVWLLWHPLLAGLHNDVRSFRWAIAFLLPLAWLAVIDWLGAGRELRWQSSDSAEDARIFTAAWQSAIFAALVYACIFYFRHPNLKESRFMPGEGFASLIWSVFSHVLLFMAIFVGLFFVRGVAGLFRRPKVEFFLYVVAAQLMLAAIFRSLVFRQLSFGGAGAVAYSLTFGFCSVAAFAGLGLRLFPPDDNVESGLALLLTPFRWASLLPGAAGLIPLGLIAVLAYVLEVRLALLDWNYLLQKLTVILIWSLAFANLYDLSDRRQGKRQISAARGGALLLVAVAALGAYKALVLWRPEFPQASHRKLNISEVLDAYGAYDVSFKVVDDILTPPRSESSSFYEFLGQNTNIPRSVATHPAEVNLVEHLTPTNLTKPDIFIFVIDSLRRDYVSAYNPAVNFTPSMEAFARENVVMENAFTRYGGTGLSEPSIWVGGMMLHQQYITPFYPMNALAKLLQTDGYRSLISKDAILSAIVPPMASSADLDEGTSEKDLDFCQSLNHLEEKLSAKSDPNVPLFAYTQPQNIHISVIHRQGESVPKGETYPGFYAPYASRLKRMDACFGRFVEVLKQSGRYDNSIVMLTSDHGDSLGEGGRWGHAYTLYPEIIKIPLIIHLPAKMRAALSIDTRSLAFLTDITPTLYYLLGHRPIVRNELFGRPLFMEPAAGPATSYLRDSYLMASSYGPVYGVLGGQGRSLYVADGVNYKDYLFDLGDPLGSSKRLSAPVREENEKTIRDGITAIGHFYHFQ
jgi:hypothetical protein